MVKLLQVLLQVLFPYSKDDVDNNKLFVIHEDKFQKGETITGATSGRNKQLLIYTNLILFKQFKSY